MFAFEGLRLEFAWHISSRSVTAAESDPAAEPERWYALGDDPEDPADLAALAGQRLWAVDVLEVARRPPGAGRRRTSRPTGVSTAKH